MFAHYVVALVKGVPTPFIVFPSDPKGLNRPLDALKEFDIQQDVVSAGTLTWTTGRDAKVTCYGRGDVVVNKSLRKVATFQSRGPQDAQLCQKLLSKPLPYMVLRFPGKYHPVLLSPGDSHNLQLFRQFDVRPHKAVLGAGWIDFGLATGTKPVCYGQTVFDRYEHARVDVSVKKQSRGLIDMTIIEHAFVKPQGDERFSGMSELAFA
jgi:hypothetical protein